MTIQKGVRIAEIEILMPYSFEVLKDEGSEFSRLFSSDIPKAARYIRSIGNDEEYFKFLLTEPAKHWSDDKTGVLLIEHIDKRMEKIPRINRFDKETTLENLKNVIVKTDNHFVRQTIKIFQKISEDQWKDAFTVLAFLHGLESVAINRKIRDAQPYTGFRLCRRCFEYFFYNYKGRIPHYCENCRYQSKLESQRKSKTVEHLKYCVGCGKLLTGRQRVTCDNAACRKRRERKKKDY